MNLNTNPEKFSDKDFELACELSGKTFSHSELIEMLKDGNIQQKQFSALCLDSVNSKAEGEVLTGNLTGCDGKIREAVALKINQLLNQNPKSSDFMNFPEIFANASIDINANICRLVIDSVILLKTNPDFKKKYLKRILMFIKETFTEMDKFIFRDKKYVINKQLFKLYWCLESLKLFVDDIPTEVLLNILERTSQEKEYTIREKTAQILGLTDNISFTPLINKLKLDKNYYVKTALHK